MNSVTQGQPPSEEKIDEIDRIILSIVSSNPMITNAEIGEQVGMSPSSALRRRQRLEETGVITGYRAVIDHKALGHVDRLLVEMNMRSSDANAIQAVSGALHSEAVVEVLEFVVGTATLIAIIAVKSTSQTAFALRNTLECMAQIRTIDIRILGPAPVFR